MLLPIYLLIKLFDKYEKLRLNNKKNKLGRFCTSLGSSKDITITLHSIDVKSLLIYYRELYKYIDENYNKEEEEKLKQNLPVKVPYIIDIDSDFKYTLTLTSDIINNIIFIDTQNVKSIELYFGNHPSSYKTYENNDQSNYIKIDIFIPGLRINPVIFKFNFDNNQQTPIQIYYESTYLPYNLQIHLAYLCTTYLNKNDKMYFMGYNIDDACENKKKLTYEKNIEILTEFHYVDRDTGESSGYDEELIKFIKDYFINKNRNYLFDSQLYEVKKDVLRELLGLPRFQREESMRKFKEYCGIVEDDDN